MTSADAVRAGLRTQYERPSCHCGRSAGRGEGPLGHERDSRVRSVEQMPSGLGRSQPDLQAAGICDPSCSDSDEDRRLCGGAPGDLEFATERYRDAIAELCVGDPVRINRNVRPGYLHGEHGVIVDLDDHAVTVRLLRPVGRFRSGELRCAPLALDKLGRSTWQPAA